MITIVIMVMMMMMMMMIIIIIIIVIMVMIIITVNLEKNKMPNLLKLIRKADLLEVFLVLHGRQDIVESIFVGFSSVLYFFNVFFKFSPLDKRRK